MVAVPCRCREPGILCPEHSVVLRGLKARVRPILAQIGNGQGWCTAYANKAAKLLDEARDQFGNDGVPYRGE